MPVTRQPSPTRAIRVSLPAPSNAHAPQTSLLGIPAELRLHIYRYLLQSVPTSYIHRLHYIPVGPVYNNGLEYDLVEFVSRRNAKSLLSIYSVSSAIRKEVIPLRENELWPRRFYIQEFSSAVSFLTYPSVMQGVQKIVLDLGFDFRHFKAILDMAGLCPKMSLVILRHGDLGDIYENWEDYQTIILEEDEEEEEEDSYIEYFQQQMDLPRPFDIELQLRADDRFYWCDIPVGDHKVSTFVVEDIPQFDNSGGCG